MIKENLPSNGGEPVLKIENLKISFDRYKKGTEKYTLDVINDLHITVNAGEMVAVVGSSGSGKSLLAHAVLGMLPYNAKVSGKITYFGEELTKEKTEKLRGNEIVLVPQSLSYLDPLMKIGPQICKGKKDKSIKEKLRGIFRNYELKEEVMDLYPFELSGGMNRRIMISTALIGEPKLVIADEPTPGLDLKVAKRAMGHFRELADNGAAVLVITHDLELALETADKIAVFYAGTTLEQAKASDFSSEETLRHPYTKALWRALPQNGFQYIGGVQPSPENMPSGCPFAPRCEKFTDECSQKIPYRKVRDGFVRCIYGD